MGANRYNEVSGRNDEHQPFILYSGQSNGSPSFELLQELVTNGMMSPNYSNLDDWINLMSLANQYGTK